MFIRFCFGSWGWGSEGGGIFTENVPSVPGFPRGLGPDNCRKQAIAQVCVVCSPQSAVVCGGEGF
jgi:hypothetical protein